MKLQKGMLIWADHSADVWQPARILEVLPNKQIKVKYIFGDTKVLKANKNFHRISSIENIEEDIVDNDLSKLDSLSTPSVLNSIRKAYHNGVYYCNLGAGTILAVNPFQDVSNLFDEKKIASYHSSLLSELSCMPAHVFAVAERALRNMKEGNNQSVIISGESGAGKTWTVRCLMRYLATVNLQHAALNLSDSFVGDEIEHRVLSSNPILEAFGNAATPRNHNSSRFGKYIQLQYDRCGTMVGANLHVYLLEKTRVSNRDQFERSYHIFYQMLNGCSEEERKEWKLPDAEVLNKVPTESPEQNQNSNNSKKRIINGGGDAANELNQSYERMDDESAFEKTRQSMMSVGIFTEAQNQIFTTLSAILHLNQLEFEGDDDLSNPCTVRSEFQANTKTSAQLLAVPINHLVQTLTFRKIEAGSTRSADRRRSIFKRPCTRAECRARRDAMVKCVYERLFLWLVKQIGNDLSAPDKSAFHFIGLLDVYGFESFKHNCLEQLCINYANEKLQQYYIHNFLKLKQDELALEGVSWDGMEINDKISCLNALESTRNSLFALLNEECRLNRTTDALQLKSRLTDSFHKSPYITQPRISTESPSFTVNHYAGKVVYAVELLTVKNKDELPLEIRELLVDSTNPFICELFLDKSPDATTPSKGKSLETVLSQFKKSLDELLTTMSTTNCNYIRCIKPNMESLPSKFDSRHVVEQLKSSGVVKTIQICGSLHPHQLSYPHFISQHVFVLRLGKNKPSNVKDYAQLDLKKSQKVCRQILTEVLNGQKQVESEKLWQFGKTSIFLSGDLYEVLQTMRSEAVNISATKIQTAWRYFTQRRFCRLLMKRVIQRRETAATTLQHHWRLRWIVRKCRKERKQEITARNNAATLLQHFWRIYKANQLRGRAASVIQSAYRKWKERMSYKQTEASDEEVVALEPVVLQSIPLQFASVHRNDTLLQPNIDLETNLASLDENLTEVTFEQLTDESSLIYVCNIFKSLPVEDLNRKHKYGNFSFFYLASFHIHVSPIDLLKLYFLVGKENNSSIFSFSSNEKRVYEFNAPNVKPCLPSILPYSDVVPFKMFN